MKQPIIVPENIKIFYDGTHITDHIDKHFVQGVTTNTSYVSAAGITDYKSFMQQSMEVVGEKPISFQITAKDTKSIIDQATYICNLGPNVYVKIPIVLPNGDSTSTIISDLSAKGYNVNVTCIHTVDQIHEAYDSIDKQSKSIISVFAGGISDTGNYPELEINTAVKLCSENDNVEVLWAGCQHILHLIEAQDSGCDIITVPDGIMKKIGRIGIDKFITSLNKTSLFYSDAESIDFDI